jgi:transcriptional regulator GlxA family with amidase domain
MSTQRTVGILVFPVVEILDFTGPYEVFSVAGRTQNPKPFQVKTIATEPGPITTANGLSINPDYTMENAPQPEIFLVPGGMGTRPLIKEANVIDYVRRTADHAEYVLSVCTGSLLLAKAGLVDGLNTTTHWGAYDLLQELAPTATVCKGQRVCDNGRVVCSAGVAAGIDMAFHVVEKLHGKPLADETKHYIEWN